MCFKNEWKFWGGGWASHIYDMSLDWSCQKAEEGSFHWCYAVSDAGRWRDPPSEHVSGGTGVRAQSSESDIWIWGLTSPLMSHLIYDRFLTFHAKMDSIKDRNDMDLTEAEDIEKRWQEYTELFKKDLNDLGNHGGVITHWEPDILECEVKWALGSITTNKASGDQGILAELFQILKDVALKVLHSIYQQIWKIQQCPQNWKSSVFISISKNGNAKEKFKLLHNSTHFTC